MAGILCAFSIVHKGTAPSFMSPLLYQILIAGLDSVTPAVTDICDVEITNKLKEVGVYNVC
jgi:hypothetical protein